MIQVHLKAAEYFAIRGKKWQNSFSVGFAVECKIDTTSLECMGASWWGTRGTCPPTFSGGGIQYAISPHFFCSGFIFGEVPKIKVTFATFCVKCFSC